MATEQEEKEEEDADDEASCEQLEQPELKKRPAANSKAKAADRQVQKKPAARRPYPNELCPGRNGESCIFSATCAGSPAAIHTETRPETLHVLPSDRIEKGDGLEAAESASNLEEALRRSKKVGTDSDGALGGQREDSGIQSQLNTDMQADPMGLSLCADPAYWLLATVLLCQGMRG